MAKERFELSLRGGTVERGWRRARPEIDGLPWGTLDLRDATVEELLAGRRDWTESALQEHASAASFSLVVRLLVKTRAPIDLTAAIARFPVDELAHAELCARMANELGGGTPLDYDPQQLLPPPTAAEEQEPELAAAARVLQGMCVRESWSLAMLRALAKAQVHALPRGVLERIVDDEKGHSGLGWSYLDWLAPDLGPKEIARLTQVARGTLSSLRRSLAQVARTPAQRFSRFGLVGSMGRDRYLATSERAIATRIVKPLARFGIAVE